MISVVQYLYAFWSVVVVNCVAYPENLRYCVRDLDVWLLPEAQRAAEVVLQRDIFSE